MVRIQLNHPLMMLLAALHVPFPHTLLSSTHGQNSHANNTGVLAQAQTFLRLLPISLSCCLCMCATAAPAALLPLLPGRLLACTSQ